MSLQRQHDCRTPNHRFVIPTDRRVNKGDSVGREAIFTPPPYPLHIGRGTNRQGTLNTAAGKSNHEAIETQIHFAFCTCVRNTLPLGSSVPLWFRRILAPPHRSKRGLPHRGGMNRKGTLTFRRAVLDFDVFEAQTRRHALALQRIERHRAVASAALLERPRVDKLRRFSIVAWWNG